jgi:3-keto-disaccharide hydrolase
MWTIARVFSLSGAIVLSALSLTTAPAADPEPGKSALEREPAGWTDILPGKDLPGWKRVPIPPGSKLKEPNPWKLSDDGKMLICNGVGYHEMLLYDKQLADTVFHVEWRFEAIEGKKGYNSGVYTRNSADGKVWHQAQVGSQNVGYLFGDTLVDGQLKRMREGGQGTQRGKPAGEWNTYEITCKGKTMSLWVNGYTTAEWKDCQVPGGFVGLEAEGWVIEFRNLKVKELK